MNENDFDFDDAGIDDQICNDALDFIESYTGSVAGPIIYEFDGEIEVDITKSDYFPFKNKFDGEIVSVDSDSDSEVIGRISCSAILTFTSGVLSPTCVYTHDPSSQLGKHNFLEINLDNLGQFIEQSDVTLYHPETTEVKRCEMVEITEAPKRDLV